MHLGLVIYGSLETVSGGFLYDRLLVDYLRRQGEAVEIISLPWRTYPRHFLDNFSPAAFRRLSRTSMDLLLQDELCHPSLVLLNRFFRRRCPQTPLISMVHHLRCSEARPRWQNRLYRLAERQYLASVDGFICNSRTTARTVEKLTGGGKPLVVAVPGGNRFAANITEARIIKRVNSPGPLQVLFLGNLIPRKGLHLLISALATLPRHAWQLTVAGNFAVDPAYTQRVRQLIRGLGVTGKVTFTGPLKDEEVAACLARSHLLAVPSSYEGYGIAYLEGMAFGLPAIATTAGGAAEIITHGKDGFLIPPGDKDRLAHCLNLLLDREKLLAMSRAARETFQAHPTWEQSCAKIHDFLQNLVK